ncbi:DMT family transporter [Amaricoccus macauensis]|uniref:DMT family transporter n=1 Tax=Amaricoccus macauensis TaxID=57001 RepID=UPI003C7D34F6
MTRTSLADASPNARGAAFMVLAMAGFSSNDALIKLVSQDIPLFQAIFLRGVIVSAAFGLIAYATGVLKSVHSRRDRRALLGRTTGETLGAFCFLTALTQLPIANATAILQSMPLAITLGAAFLLHEPVGWKRYAAIAVGFLGVLVIVRPGAEGFNSYGFLAMAAVFLFTLRDLSTRQISPDVATVLAAFITSSITTCVAGIVSLFGGWETVTGLNVLTLFVGAGCLMVGYHFSIIGMRTGDVGFVSPFRYALLIWAMILGWLIYGDIPDIWMITGAGIVVAAGFYTFYEERARRR